MFSQVTQTLKQRGSFPESATTLPTASMSKTAEPPRVLCIHVQGANDRRPRYGGAGDPGARCALPGRARSLPRRAVQLDRIGANGPPRPSEEQDSARCAQAALGQAHRCQLLADVSATRPAAEHRTRSSVLAAWATGAELQLPAGH